MMDTDLARVVHQLMQAKPVMGRAQRGATQLFPQAFDVQSQGAGREGTIASQVRGGLAEGVPAAITVSVSSPA